MKHNEITKELLSMDKNFFRNLHERFNFDFEGHIGFFSISGKFTLNTVSKLVEQMGFCKSAKCLVFTAFIGEVKNRGLWAFRPVMVNLHDNTFDTTNVNGCNSYWRKADFNDMRKYDSTVSFGIVQNIEDMRSRAADRYAANKRKKSEQLRAENEAHRRSRFRAVSVQRNEDGWIDDVKARDEEGREVGLYHDYNWDERPHITNLNDIVDGSGYAVRPHKDYLEQRLKAFKAMKANKAYAQTDNSDKVTMVNALVSARKTIIEAQFKSVKTSEEVSEFISKLWDFKRILDDAEFFCTHTAEKTYASIEQSERDYQYLLKKLTA